MASSIGKGVSSLISPFKTSKLNLVSSPINFKRKSLSATSKKTVLKSPSFELLYLLEHNHFYWDLAGTHQMKASKEVCPIEEALKTSRFPLQYKAVRCLFSPERSPKSLTDGKPRSAPDDKYCRAQTLPSFDTPLRKSISAKEFDTKDTESFVLGRGSYGVVVEGRYKNNHMAVKMVAQCQKYAEVLKSEMNALKLKHPNIIQVFQIVIGPDTNIGFIFMELFSKTNLEHILQCETVYHFEKLRYLKQIGSALQYCHSNGVLHLDVKPKNIIVKTKDKTCKLCDFGSSVNKSDIARINNPRKGTLKYTAPELLKGNNPTEKSDVYSFGITVWQTIYQEVPYEKEDLQQVVYKVVKHNYRPASCKATYNVKVHHIYEACWQADPKQRPSMTQVLLMMG